MEGTIPSKTAWLWGLLVFLLAVACWPGLVEPGRAPRLSLLLASLLIVPFWLWGLRDGGRLPRWPAIGVGLLMLLGGASVWSVPAPERSSSVFDGALLFIPALLGLAVSCHSASGARQRLDRALGLGASAGLAVVSLLGLAEAWLGWQGLPSAHPPAATFVNRNVAAQALVVLVPLATVTAARCHRLSLRGPCAAAACLGLMFLVATRSRGGWVAAAAGWGFPALVWLALRLRETGLRQTLRGVAPAAGLVAAAVVAASLVPIAGREPLPDVGRVIGMTLRPVEGGTVDTRRALWRNAAHAIRSRPFLGWGPGRFPVVYPLFQRSSIPTPGFGLERQPRHPHNDLVETAFEQGLPATILMLLLLSLAMWRSLRELAERGTAPPWGLARLGVIGGALAHGMVSFPLHSPLPMALVWLLAGRGWRGARPAFGFGGRRGLSLVAALTLLLAALSASAALHALRVERWLGQAVTAARDGDCAAVLAATRRIANRAPHRAARGLAAALTWRCDKDPQSSLAQLEPALASYPHRLELLLATASRRLKSGRVDAAESAYRHVLEIEPAIGRAWLGLAMCRAEAGDLPGWRRACDRALRLEPTPPVRLFCGASAGPDRPSLEPVPGILNYNK